MKFPQQPVSNVRWVHRDALKPNHYNPNAVAPPELDLLKISILEDGWTQPIVVTQEYVIVDGYHRYVVSGDIEVYRVTLGYVPVVTVHPRDEASQMMATVRHNRARGTHAVLKMADLVAAMLQAGLKVREICERLQMEREEVTRLANRKGIPQSWLIEKAGWGEAWQPE